MEKQEARMNRTGLSFRIRKNPPMLRACLFSCCLLIFSSMDAQVLMNRDSLLALLPKAGKDSQAVELLIQIGQQYETQEPELAKTYYRQAGSISREIGYTLGEIRFIANYTYVLNQQGAFDSSLYYNLRSVDLSRKIGDSAYIAKTTFNTGTSYRVLGDYENAVRYYVEGQKMFQQIRQPDAEALLADLLQTLYCDMHQYDRAVEYGEKALALARNMPDNQRVLADYLSNLGNSYAFQNRYPEALRAYRESLAQARATGNAYTESVQLLNIGDALFNLGRYDTLLTIYTQALDISRAQGSRENEVMALRGLGLYYQFKGNYTAAGKHLEDALRIAETEGLRKEKVKVLDLLSKNHFATGDVAKGYFFSRLSTRLGDSLLNASTQERALVMEKRFGMEQKEARIRQLEAEARIQALDASRRRIINAILAGSIILLAAFSILIYRNMRNKRKLEQQRIRELETHQKLLATEAVMQGEQKERTRLAQDLHDGLGGMLSGIKYAFNHMRGNLVMTPDNALVFERSMDMLDSSIRELRRVAHNMMPETLVKSGLDTALRDFCHDVERSGAVKVSYSSIGLSQFPVNQTVAINIYRIVQELLSNIIRHASAQQAIVQVSKQDNSVTITVEDNGKGFDTTRLEESRGMGWESIRNRVDFLKGRLDLISKSGRGTSVHIEIDLI
jgi:signal transduction histidine kinase